MHGRWEAGAVSRGTYAVGVHLHGDGALHVGSEIAEDGVSLAVVCPHATAINDTSAKALVRWEPVLADGLQSARCLDGSNLQHTIHSEIIRDKLPGPNNC